MQNSICSKLRICVVRTPDISHHQRHRRSPGWRQICHWLRYRGVCDDSWVEAYTAFNPDPHFLLPLEYCKEHDMNAETKIIIKDLKRRLSNHLKDNLIDVILFGSQQRGDCSVDSDYDILIIVKEGNNWKMEREISDICYEIELKYDIITDIHVLAENELNLPRGKQPIFYNAIKQGYYV